MVNLKRETQNVEFKESWRDEYLKWICGFANAQGGELYIGVCDDGSICGVKDAGRLMEEIPNKTISLLGVVVDVDLLALGAFDVVRIRVNAYSVPISLRGVYYYRSGATKQELSGVALQDFLFRKTGLSWDDVVCEGAKIEDIDEHAIHYFLQRAIESGRMSKSAVDLSIHDLLEGLGLLSVSGELKNAAVLLFGRYPQRMFPSAQFKIGRFGADESDLLFQDQIEGNILQMADKVVEVLRSKYLISPVTYRGLTRIEKLEVPEESLREAIFNAIVHRNYAGVHTQMKVWNDRIELWNDGILPIGLTVDKLSQPHSSRPRNRNIANVFYRAGFIEAWGRGIFKITSGFVSAGLGAPVFSESCGGMLVTFQRNQIRDIKEQQDAFGTNNGTNSKVGGTKTEPFGTNNGTNSKVGGTKTEPFGTNNGTNNSEEAKEDIQTQILTLIKENPRISQNKMAQKLGVSRRTVVRQMTALAGFVRRVGTARGGHWEMIERGK